MTSPRVRWLRQALFGLLVPCAAQGGGAGPGTGAVVWAADLPSALAEGKAANKLVLVCFNMDGEAANERALAMYRSAEFARTAAEVVCVPCSADDHGDGAAPCARFGTCTCAEHLRNEKAARRHFFGGLRDSVAPQHLLLFPDGLVAWHAIYEVAPSEIARAIEGAGKMKDLPLAQRLRSQRAFLEQMRRRAATVPEAYLQVQARLAQTPPAAFADALAALTGPLAERIVRDLEGYDRERALLLLQACRRHPAAAVRGLAAATAARVAQRPAADPARPTEQPPATPPPLTAPLTVLGPADDLARVHWSGPEQSLDGCRDHVTLLWFFLVEAEGLADQVAAMNEFAAREGTKGVRMLGLVSALRPSEAVERLAELGCTFPVGAYQATSALRLFAIERFPAWVVLDPDTNVVHRSRQDGAAFDWSEAPTLAARMADSPLYRSRLAVARPAK